MLACHAISDAYYHLDNRFVQDRSQVKHREILQLNHRRDQLQGAFLNLLRRRIVCLLVVRTLAVVHTLVVRTLVVRMALRTSVVRTSAARTSAARTSVALVVGILVAVHIHTAAARILLVVEDTVDLLEQN